MSRAETSDPSLKLVKLKSSARDVKAFENLMLVTDSSSKPYLLGVDSDSQVSKICSGVSSHIIGRLEGQSKAQSVWVSANFPSCFIVSLLGSTSVLCFQEGVFTELDQSQTKLILSETTISVSDLYQGMVVQASRYWVNICSPRTSCMYRSSHGERVICVSSSSQHPEVAVALRDGDLVRGRSKLVILQMSETSGMVVEKQRREYNHEILELVTMTDGSIVAITADKSILFLSQTLSILKNFTIDYPLKSIAVLNSSSVLVSTSTGFLLTFNTTTHDLVNTTMLGQRPVSFGRTSNSSLFAFFPGRYFILPDNQSSPQRFHPPLDEEFHSLASIGTMVAGVSMLGEIVIFESPLFDNSDFDLHRVQIQNLSTKLCGQMIILPNGRLFLGGPSGYPTFVSSHSSRSFPMMEGTVCGALVYPDLLLTYSIHEKSLVLSKLIFSEHSLDIMRLLGKPTGTTSSVSCIECIDTEGTVVAAFENGDIQTLKISEATLPRLIDTVAVNFPPGNCWVLPLSAFEFVLVHSLMGVFTLTSDLKFTSVSPSFVHDSPLANPITCACVVDHDHVMTGDTLGVVSLYSLPSLPRLGSRMDQCMQVTDIQVSAQASSSRINKLVHCRDSRKLIYYTSEDVSIGVISTGNFPLNWYWD